MELRRNASSIRKPWSVVAATGVALTVALTLAACAPGSPQAATDLPAAADTAALPAAPTAVEITPPPDAPDETTTSGAPRAEDVGLPNPASVFCIESGGELEIRTEATGGQVGICVLPDGTECEEWAFYRGECGPGAPGAAAPSGDTSGGWGPRRSGPGSRL